MLRLIVLDHLYPLDGIDRIFQHLAGKDFKYYSRNIVNFKKHAPSVT
jgi:hypothetical protein